MSELEVETRELDDVVLLYPQGFINAHTVRLFEGEIQKALEKRRFKIVVNCAGLAYIASAGLGRDHGSDRGDPRQRRRPPALRAERDRGRTSSRSSASTTSTGSSRPRWRRS